MRGESYDGSFNGAAVHPSMAMPARARHPDGRKGTIMGNDVLPDDQAPRGRKEGLVEFGWEIELITRPYGNHNKTAPAWPER